MLVLTRKSSERVFIGESIELTVLEIRGNRVRLGLSAPPGIPIHREEVRKAIADGDDGQHRAQPIMPLLSGPPQRELLRINGG